MELKQLKYLITIARCKTMLKAAEELYISQSGLTRSIQSLEEELGMKLFDRVGNHLVLNEYGMTMVEEGQKIVDDIEKLQNKVIQQYYYNTHLCIGSCAPAPLWQVRNLMKRYYSHVPFKCDLNGDNEELLKKFNEKEFAALILDYPINRKDVICFKLCEEVLHISITKDHPLSSKKEITFNELDGFNFLEYNDVGYWHDVCTQNMPHSHLIVQNDLELYQILQKQSSLITFRTNLTIPRFHLYEERVYIPITNNEAKLSFYFICHKEDYSKVELIKEHVNEVDWTHYRREDFEIG